MKGVKFFFILGSRGIRLCIRFYFIMFIFNKCYIYFDNDKGGCWEIKKKNIIYKKKKLLF